MENALYNSIIHMQMNAYSDLWKYKTGHEIAPNTVANATKIILLATKIQKLVAKLATRILWVLYILPWCFWQLNEALK